MQINDIRDTTQAKFTACYGQAPAIVAYAPGRVEVLGNHTDYNEGFVLSAAIDAGTCFAVAPVTGTTCRLTAGDLMREVRFAVDQPEVSQTDTWSNYCKGVLNGLLPLGTFDHGFDALFFGNIPLGSGLSSSAALSVGTALALTQLYGIAIDTPTIAKIAQQAEHLYAGVKCGLLDPITSLCGRDGMLVRTDFRSLEVTHAPLGDGTALLICNTHAKHALVDGEYNERRADCERAAAHFKARLSHPVQALRDVTWSEWELYREGLDERAARRAAHPIGENERVLNGAALLTGGDVAGFGKLMFDSHESSRRYFENSCEELDVLVEAARSVPGVLGARLSGGGFGGSVVVLVYSEAIEAASQALAEAYATRYGKPCDIRAIHPSAGARLLAFD